MNTYQIKKHADEMGVNVLAAVKMRIRYLVDVAGQWDEYLDEITKEIPEIAITDLFKELDMLRRFELSKDKAIKTDITDEMIFIAKSFPIDSVVGFGRNMKAVAFCHDDKNPSLSWDKKRNKAHCFPCGKSFNAIDVLIDRDGLTFIQAVKKLNGA